MEDTPPSHLSRPRPWEVGRCAKIHQKLEHVNFPRFFNFFLHFFIILLARMLKFTKNWKNPILLEFFYIFLHFFLQFACRVPNFPNLGEFWHPASKMIKKCKKNVKKKFENSPKIGKFQFSSSFFTFFFAFFYHFACKDAKIHQKLENSNFPRVFYIFLHFFCIS